MGPGAAKFGSRNFQYEMFKRNYKSKKTTFTLLLLQRRQIIQANILQADDPS